MDVPFFKLLILTSSLVIFCECRHNGRIYYRKKGIPVNSVDWLDEDSHILGVSNNYCRDYQYEEKPLFNDTEFFSVDDYRFKIAVDQELSNCQHIENYIVIEVKRQTNEAFAMRIGASKNPNLIEKEENLKLCDLDLFDSNDLTGEFIYDGLYGQVQVADCSFSSNLENLRTVWKAPDADDGYYYFYFEYTDHLNRKSKFKKSINIINKFYTYSNDQKNSQKMDQEFDEECFKIYQSYSSENSAANVVEEATHHHHHPSVSGSSVPKIITVLIIVPLVVFVFGQILQGQELS